MEDVAVEVAVVIKKVPVAEVVVEVGVVVVADVLVVEVVVARSSWSAFRARASWSRSSWSGSWWWRVVAGGGGGGFGVRGWGRRLGSALRGVDRCVRSVVWARCVARAWRAAGARGVEGAGRVVWAG